MDIQFSKYIRSVDVNQGRVQGVEFLIDLEERPLFRCLSTMSPNTAVAWVDRFGCFESVAAEWCLAGAIEQSLKIQVPMRANVLRAIFGELQRVLWSHRYFADFFRVAGDIYREQVSRKIVEKIFDIQEVLTGSRVLPSALAVGGLRRDFSVGEILKIKKNALELVVLHSRCFEELEMEHWFHQRIANLLIVKSDFFDEIRAYGPMSYASGAGKDLRTSGTYRPYADYDIDTFTIHRLRNGARIGSAGARFQAVEFLCVQAIDLIKRFILTLPSDSSYGSYPEPDIKYDEIATFAVEAPSGAMWCSIGGGKIYLESYSSKILPHLSKLLSGLGVEDLELALVSLGVDFSQGGLS